MDELTKLPNIGKEISRQLTEVGIISPKQLFEAGSKKAWLMILAIDPSACYNRLCALEGAILGVNHCFLPIEVKNELKEFYKEAKCLP